MKSSCISTSRDGEREMPLLRAVKSNPRRPVTVAMIKVLGARQEWKCNMCKEIMSNVFEVDHIKPLFQGGLDHLENMQILCKECHGQKTQKEVMNHNSRDPRPDELICGRCNACYSPYFWKKHICG